MTEKEKAMTRDEALSKANDVYDDTLEREYKSGASFHQAQAIASKARLASLKASGWTLARVEQRGWLDKLRAQLIAVANIPDAAERNRAEKTLAEFHAWLAAQEGN